MSQRQEKKLSFPKILLIFLIHIAIWGAYTHTLLPVMKNNLGDLGDLGYQLIGESIKLILWTVPAIILVQHYYSDMYLTLHDMLTSRFKPMPYVLLALGVLVYSLTASIFINGNIAITFPEHPSWIMGTVFLVGITEDALYQGFFLNALLKKTKAIFALTISSLMFVAIHLPWWIFNNRFPNPLSALGDCLAIFALGLVYGWTFMKSRNIFVPMSLHMLWNLLLTLFVV